jgi:hypothetical protein
MSVTGVIRVPSGSRPDARRAAVHRCGAAPVTTCEP